MCLSSASCPKRAKLSTVHAMPIEVPSTVNIKAENGKASTPHNGKKRAGLPPANVDVTSAAHLRPGNAEGVSADASAPSQVKKKKQNKDEAAHNLNQETVVVDT